MYKILIADDHPLVREAIVNVVQDSFSGSETFETDTLNNTMEAAAQHSDLDLILLDLNMPGMEGLSGLATLRKTYPSIPVVMISAEEDKQTVLQSMSYGSVGFITKSSPRNEIANAIELILNGSVYLPSEIIRSEKPDNMTEMQAATISPELLASLTRRQMLVLERMSKGESNKQIAYNLSIAETTVKAHVSAILRKLGVSNRIQAVLSTSNIDFSQYLKR